MGAPKRRICMKNVLTPALLATLIALPVLAQPATPGEPTGGNMQQMPTSTGSSMPVEDEGQSTMPNGDVVGTSQPTTAGQVRVRMPDGKLVDIPNTGDTPWYRSADMKGYTSYYFDPANGVYVVRGNEAPANWPKKNWGVE